jgi:phosphoglycolate phosphatase-like HAD superfamily hydrolase
MKRNIVIVDLDGTLCDSGHRDHHAQAKEWDQFHSKLRDDKPHRDVALTVLALQKTGVKAFGLTGRNEAHRTATLAWLLDNGIELDALMMRPDNDWTPDHELKPKALAAAFGSIEGAKARVLMILEDRDKVVEAWRNLGFRCWQVQPGGY